MVQKPYHTRMVVPYVHTHMICINAYGMKYAYGTQHTEDILFITDKLLSVKNLWTEV